MWFGLLVEVLAGGLAPIGCAACDAPVRPAALFCAPCAETVLRAPRAASAAFLLGGAAHEAITRLKYGDRPDLGARLGRALGEVVKAGRASPRALVVPVPLHPEKLRERGYNQAALLAAPVARALGAELGCTILGRVRATHAQARLAREARLTNLKGAFRCARPRSVTSRHVVLVDDVRTTGATLAECTEVLLGAGAASVLAVTLAVRDDQLHATA